MLAKANTVAAMNSGRIIHVGNSGTEGDGFGELTGEAEGVRVEVELGVGFAVEVGAVDVLTVNWIVALWLTAGWFGCSTTLT